MSDTVKLNNCPKCGAPIPADAPQGLCPKCVLLGAASSTDAGAPPTATAEIPSLERVAAAFPQFEILELIGRGGMSFVFKARQPHLDRFVALKLLPDKLARDPRFTERFNREGRVLARLNHPNIVSVYDFGVSEQFCFLVMEFVDGLNLRQAMQAGRFSPGEALAVVPKICEALQYAHSQGILHRDIKPENILLDAQGHVKIADFGIAKLVGEEKSDVTLTGTGAAIGTPHYMAPEQLEKPADVDHRADIYSLGVVFYEMLTGELPIGRFAPPSSKTPVGTAVDEVVFRTLEKDRERRYQSAGEMKTQVEHLSEPGAATSAAEPPKIAAASSTVPKWSQKAIWSAVLTGLSLPLGFPLMILIYLRLGGLGGPFILGLGLISLPGLAGCILGWTALSDIRAHHGRLRGLPLALFAALAWPLFLLVSVTIGVPARHALSSAPTPVVKSLSFGPERERVLPEPAPGVACLLDFETGELLTPFDALAQKLNVGMADIGPEAVSWLRDSGADAVVNMPNAGSLRLFEGVALSVAHKPNPPLRWEEFTPADVDAALGQATFERSRRFQNSGTTFYATPALSPDALAFITREGSRGVMEIIGLNKDPRGLKLRYKLLQSAPAHGRAPSPTLHVEPASPGNAQLEPISGPEVQVTVPDLFSGGAQLAFDGLAQGVTLPAESKKWSRTILLQWLADEGVDLGAIHYDDDHYGWGLALRTNTRPIYATWSSITSATLKSALARNQMPLEKIDAVSDGINLYRLYPASRANGQLPIAFAMQTRSGRLVAAQITGFSTNPPALNLRYKFVNNLE